MCLFFSIDSFISAHSIVRQIEEMGSVGRSHDDNSPTYPQFWHTSGDKSVDMRTFRGVMIPFEQAGGLSFSLQLVTIGTFAQANIMTRSSRTKQNRVHICFLAILLFTLIYFGGRQKLWAHGGVIVGSGITEEYEWLVATSPFPVTTDDNVITLLVYDADSFEPVNGLKVDLYLVPPGETTPCCDQKVHMGPIDLNSDPEIYPGDYSQIVTPGEIGEWGVGFVIMAEGKEPLQVEMGLEVRQGTGPAENLTDEDAVGEDAALNADALPAGTADTADADATATAFAQNIEEARRKPNDASAQSAEANAEVNTEAQQAARPNTNIFTGKYWWVWLIGGVAALMGVAVVALRPGDEEED